MKQKISLLLAILMCLSLLPVGALADEASTEPEEPEILTLLYGLTVFYTQEAYNCWMEMESI